MVHEGVHGERATDPILYRKSSVGLIQDKANADLHPAAETPIPSVLA